MIRKELRKGRFAEWTHACVAAGKAFTAFVHHVRLLFGVLVKSLDNDEQLGRLFLA